MYNIIIAGCGSMSNRWIDIITKRDDCTIRGLVDLNADAIKGEKEKYKLNANAYTNISEALEKEDANLVLDITVPQAHFNVVTTALKAGCDVFGEKPMSHTLENAEKMVECAERTKKNYFVMQNRRYVPGICALQKFLQSQQPGRIGQVSANFQLGPHFGGFRDEMDNPLITDMAIHTFDAARYITGKNAISVYCYEFNPSWSWYKGNANAVCIFEMEDDSVFDYRGSWCANGLITSWESEWRVACANGAVIWDGAEKIQYGLPAGSDGTIPTAIDIPTEKMESEGHQGCINEMFDALKNGKKPQTDCRDNINSIRMVYKAVESARTGQKVMF